jgi:RimJ/RimL family protein N-acetyltransferase
MIDLRPAQPADQELLFKWRNMSEIISNSASQRSIAESEHNQWYQEIMRDDNTKIFIFCDEERPIGQVRFDRMFGGCKISLYLIPGETGKGRGALVISMAVNAIVKKWPNLGWIEARIRSENLRSRRAFSTAGFHELYDHDISPAHDMIYMRKSV